MRVLIPLLTVLALAACGKPQPPETERRPEPQAAELREKIEKPLAEAEAASAAMEHAVQADKQALDEATGDADATDTEDNDDTDATNENAAP